MFVTDKFKEEPKVWGREKKIKEGKLKIKKTLSSFSFQKQQKEFYYSVLMSEGLVSRSRPAGVLWERSLRTTALSLRQHAFVVFFFFPHELIDFLNDHFSFHSNWTHG